MTRVSAMRHARLTIAPLLMALFACSSGKVLEHLPPLAAKERPNIIVILADDLGYGDLGAYGSTRIRTPNIDSLAANGITFTQSYASANVCSPSRAGLMTGRYAIRAGLAWKVVGADDKRGLPESEETLGELVQRADYHTMYVGKWHLGRFPDFLPLHHGFDEFYGVPHSNDMPNFALYDGADLVEEPVRQKTLTRRYTERAVDFISRNASEPFLLFLSHTSPHIPLFPGDGFHGKSDAGIYGDVVEELDWSTGEIVRALNEAGVLHNTLVIVTSDNGPFFEGGPGKLKGGKGTTWEGGYKVPLILSWPDMVDAGVTTDAITMNIDLLPTIAAVVGLNPLAAKIDGVSLLPVLRGDETKSERYLYYFDDERVVGVRSQRWKYLTHSYYRTSLGAFEEFHQLPGFNASYELLFRANEIDAEAYSYADRYPDITRNHRRVLDQARDQFSLLRTKDLATTFPESTREKQD